MNHKRLELRITGIVQGVFYRVHTRDEARRLGVNGWVRNCEDGSVELVAEGPENLLSELASWCEEGPPGAQVTGVDRKWNEPQGKLQGFTIRY